MSERQRPIVDLHAGCACGQVRVRVSGPVRAMLLCACRDCQKTTGAGHAAVAILDADSVTVTGDTQSFDRPAASGATFTRTFCPTCGTPIHGRSSRWAEALLLPPGLFDDNDWFAPTQLIFARSHRDWDTVADDIPWHETYRTKES